VRRYLGNPWQIEEKDNRETQRVVRKLGEEKYPPSPLGVGEGGEYGDYFEVRARDGVLGGIPAEAIAGSLLRYTIKLKLRLRRRLCLFNIEHSRGREPGGARTHSKGCGNQFKIVPHLSRLGMQMSST
jgi:hypothetical protein